MSRTDGDRIGPPTAADPARIDVIRQFVLETTLLAISEGILGLILGVALLRIIVPLPAGPRS